MPTGSRYPSEEDIRCRLHQTLSHWDTLPVVPVRVFTCVGLEHRVFRFLELKERDLDFLAL